VEITAEEGAAAATIGAIAARLGAPTGSIYHRFASRAEILGLAWQTIHGEFETLLCSALGEENGLVAALAIPVWARRQPLRARFLLLNERELCVGADAPEAIREAVAAQEQAIEAAFAAFLEAVAGLERPAESWARARFLVLDAPRTLIRPYLVAGQPIPGFVDTIIRELHAGIGLVGRRDPAMRLR
jgi:AcrR family transcriptional regulator